MPDSADGDQSEQVWTEIDAEDIEYARQVAAEHGVSLEVDEEAHFVGGGVGEAAILLMGAAMVVSVVVGLLEQRRGGQFIDLRPNATPIAWRNKELMFGYVVLITSDGKVELSVHEPKGMFGQVLSTLSGIIGDLDGATAARAAKAASAALGNMAEVRVVAA